MSSFCRWQLRLMIWIWLGTLFRLCANFWTLMICKSRQISRRKWRNSGRFLSKWDLFLNLEQHRAKGKMGLENASEAVSCPFKALSYLHTHYSKSKLSCKTNVQGLQIMWNLKLFFFYYCELHSLMRVQVFLSLCMQMDWYFAILVILWLCICI